MGFSLSKTIQQVKSITGYPVFATDMTKDEVTNNPTFLIYDDKGDIRKASSANQYLQDFVVSFVTRENIEVNEFDLIMGLQPCGLIFRETQKEYGRIAETDQEAKMVTFYFHQSLVVC
ncbi:hypothetical protein [Carnobacterium inhibens]|uniref:hypothetical protein n=1 Tax=Carnobacterium inhibens TaxID=147709 RepID=UPI000550559B|nr:hypothetical protein [Carnobacterium inhibens]